MIVELADYRPHMVIQGEGKQHVIPVAMIEAIVAGKLKLSEIDEADSIIQAIVREWFEIVMERWK